jgi:hypothetical protein
MEQKKHKDKGKELDLDKKKRDSSSKEELTRLKIFYERK